MLHFNGSKTPKIQKSKIQYQSLKKKFNMRSRLPGNSPMTPWGAMAPSLGTIGLEHAVSMKFGMFSQSYLKFLLAFIEVR